MYSCVCNCIASLFSAFDSRLFGFQRGLLVLGVLSLVRMANAYQWVGNAMVTTTVVTVQMKSSLCVVSSSIFLLDR